MQYLLLLFSADHGPSPSQEQQAQIEVGCYNSFMITMIDKKGIARISWREPVQTKYFSLISGTLSTPSTLKKRIDSLIPSSTERDSNAFHWASTCQNPRAGNTLRWRVAWVICITELFVSLNGKMIDCRNDQIGPPRSLVNLSAICSYADQSYLK